MKTPLQSKDIHGWKHVTSVRDFMYRLCNLLIESENIVLSVSKSNRASVFIVDIQSCSWHIGDESLNVVQQSVEENQIEQTCMTPYSCSHGNCIVRESWGGGVTDSCKTCHETYALVVYRHGLFSGTVLRNPLLSSSLHPRRTSP